MEKNNAFDFFVGLGTYLHMVGMLVFIVCAVVVLAVDLVTKVIFVTPAKVIPGIIGILPIEPNQGGAFGIFQGHIPILVIVTVLILIGGTIFYVKFKQGRKSIWYNIGCALFVGGALGNLYDRVFLGGVRDFLNFEFMNFPVFNFADVFLNIGMVMLVIYFLFIYKEKKGANNKS